MWKILGLPFVFKYGFCLVVEKTQEKKTNFCAQITLVDTVSFDQFEEKKIT